MTPKLSRKCLRCSSTEIEPVMNGDKQKSFKSTINNVVWYKCRCKKCGSIINHRERNGK